MLGHARKAKRREEKRREEREVCQITYLAA
jgi:hypothetical protein